MFSKRLSQSLAFRYIKAVAKCGSIRRAGLLLNVSSPSINRKILEFESILGSRIFERNSRGVELTAGGRLLLDHIDREELALDRIVGEIHDLEQGNGGLIQISAVEIAPRTFLAKELATFRSVVPRMSCRVKITNSDMVVNAVTSGEADFGLTIDPPKRHNLSVICVTPFFPHAIVSKTHPLSQFQELEVEECAKHPLALYDSSFHEIPGPAVQRLLYEVSGIVRTNSIEILSQMAMTGDVVCCGIIFPTNKKQRSGSLVTIPLKIDDHIRSDLALIVRRNHSQSKTCTKLIKQVEFAMTQVRFAAPSLILRG